MLNPANIDYAQVAQVAQNGSPLLLQALGRLYGVGPAERQALGADGKGVPVWVWATMAFAVGAVAGIRVYRAYPRQVPKLISGD